MTRKRNIGSEIIRLRTEEKKSYTQIKNTLNCSMGSVYYHCNRHALNDTGLKVYPIESQIKEQIQEYCKTHTIAEESQFFKLSLSSIKKHKLKNKKTHETQ